MSYHQGMQKGNLDSVKADEHGKIKKETVDLKGVSVTRVTFDVGAKWSTDLKGYAGTNSCQLPHVALVLSGTLRVVMDDGSQQDFSKNDVMLLPPGHDAWSVGNEPCVFGVFSYEVSTPSAECSGCDGTGSSGRTCSSQPQAARNSLRRRP